MKYLLISGLMAVSVSVNAQRLLADQVASKPNPSPPVSSEPTTIRLYERAAPGSENWNQKEAENTSNIWKTRVVYNVTDPTLTIFKPTAAANGTSVVICPGGGFHALSIDSEGFEVARWLAAKGVTCFVLKYRLVESKTTDPTAELMAKNGEQTEKDVAPVVKLAMADGLAAVGYVRQHATEFGLNPKRIGIMGFSAGGTVVASVMYNYTPQNRPDFVAPIYLQYEWAIKQTVPADAPPAFILAATDDQLGLAPHSVQLYTDWIKANKPAELHLYANGGHGFGMRKNNTPSDHWIELFDTWLGRALH
jgi:acetyl esterase/lipase